MRLCRNRALIFILALSFVITPNIAFCKSLLVIANIDTENAEMSNQELRDLFMGMRNPERLIPVVLEPGNQERIIFNSVVIGLTESRIQSYWAQMRFSGRAKPPKQFTSMDVYYDYIVKTPNAIGYVTPDQELPKHIVVVLEVE